MRPEAETGPFGPEEFARIANVSRETLARLKIYASMLEDWNNRHNLVSRASLQDVWRRHFWDSAQLEPLIPKHAASLVDLGTGAGFPGLVLAEILRNRGMSIVLYEATEKKCQFLHAVIARLGVKAEVRNYRIEDSPREGFDVITARAVAKLPTLLAYAHRFWTIHSVGLFLKGQNVDAELTAARKIWNMILHDHVSRSDRSGVILEVRELNPVGARTKRSPTGP